MQVKVLRKFMDAEGVLHQAFEKDDSNQFVLDSKATKIPIVKQMKKDVAEWAAEQGFVKILSKPRKVKGDVKS